VAPIIVERGLGLAFDVDERLCKVTCDDVVSRTLHRLLTGSLDLLGKGLLSCSSSMDDAGRCTVSLNGSGEMVSDQRVAELLGRLNFVTTESSPGKRQARGVCPISGARVDLCVEPTEGFVLNAEFPGCASSALAEPLPSAGGALAWLMMNRPPGAVMLKRRLTRLGWRVRTFESDECLEASMIQLECETPALVVAVECERELTQRVRDWLELPFPSTTQRVLGVLLGSKALIEEIPSAWDRRALPLSPRDLFQHCPRLRHLGY
jgi:hypothetical protein